MIQGIFSPDSTRSDKPEVKYRKIIHMGTNVIREWREKVSLSLFFVLYSFVLTSYLLEGTKNHIVQETKKINEQEVLSDQSIKR